MYEEQPQLRAIGYCRVACNDKDTGNKLLVQQQEIDRFMFFADLEFVNCFEEVGKPGEALQAAYDYCEEEGDFWYLFISDFSRLGRNQEEVKKWVNKFERGLGIDVQEATNETLHRLFNTEPYTPHLVNWGGR